MLCHVMQNTTIRRLGSHNGLTNPSPTVALSWLEQLGVTIKSHISMVAVGMRVL